jgi:hypothetical protein
MPKDMEKMRAQTSLEFLLIIAFMTIVFVSFFALANSRLAESAEQKSFEVASEIASIVKGQIELASIVNGGFSTSFIIPQIVGGMPYEISIVDKRELIIVYNGYEHVEFLPVNVSGQLNFGENTLSKNSTGRLSLNS